MKNKIPLRKCVLTGEMLPKMEMFRIIITKDNEVLYDETGKQNGRGLYLKKDVDVINKAKQTKKIESVFKVKNIDQIYDELISKLIK